MERYRRHPSGLLLAACLAAGCTGAPRDVRRGPPLSPLEEALEAAAVESLERRVREVVVETVRRTGERLGRPDPDPGAIRLEVAMGRLGRTACRANTTARTSGWGASVKIELCAEPFLSEEADLDLTPAHEAVHAYSRRQLGLVRYREMPPWIQEGSRSTSPARRRRSSSSS